MDRPAVDVVVPFRGSPADLAAVRARMGAVAFGAHDTLTIVDNSPHPHPAPGTVAAPALQTPGYARNRGTERGRAPWLVFLDADVEPDPGILDSYFDPSPAERTAMLAGAVRDQPVGPEAGAASRYTYLRASMSQEMTMQHGPWGFVQTANCAVRRSAFDAIGGFTESIRAGEDADLGYRLRAEGWETERRQDAFATHHNRTTVRALMAQKLCHGAGGAWLNRRYPGSFPARRLPGLVWWGVRAVATGLLEAARERSRDRALTALLDPATTIAYELGRSLPNHRPLRHR